MTLLVVGGTLLASATYVGSPERIVLGGGVMKEPVLLPLVQHEVTQLLNGYLDNTAVTEEISTYVTLPGLGSRAGVLGAIALAQTA